MTARGTMAWGLTIFFAGLLTRTRPATIGGAYVFLAAWLATTYAKVALGRISYHRELSAARVSVGDKVTLRIRVENRKPIPVLYLRCDDEVPDKHVLGALPTHRHYRPGRAILTNVTYLKWFERVERQFTMECVARGVFTLGTVRLSTGDLFGFRESSAEMPVVDQLTVLPRMATVKGIPWDEHFPLGVRPWRGWMHPDPLTVAGAREYVPGTPLKHIAWRTTAKTGALQEKLLEPTVQLSVVTALSLSTADHYWEGVNQELLETGIFVCASVCREMLRRGTPFGLVANSAGTRSARDSLLVRPGLSRGHLQRTLEVLARLTMPWMEFRATLRRIRREIGPDTGVIVIMTHQIQDDWAEVLALADEGRPVVVLVLAADERFASYYQRVPTYALAGRVDWRASEAISLERLV